MQKQKNNLQKILLISLSAVFILGQFGRFQFGSGIALNILDIVVFLFLLTGLFNPKQTIATPLTKPLTIFISICVLSLVFNFWHISQVQLIGAVLYFIRWVLYAGVFFVIFHSDNTIKQFSEKLLLITGSILVGIGFFQYIFYTNLRNLYYLGWDDHLYRLFSTFLDPNFAGAFYVLFSIFIGDKLLKSLKQNNRKNLIIYAILVLFTLVATFLTYSRSALLMLIAAWFTLLLLHKKLKFIIILLLLLAVYIITISPRFYVENLNLFRTFSTEERLKSVGVALNIIKDNPISGVGFNAYRDAQLRYHYRNPVGANYSHADGGTDNSFLFVAATTGIIGLLAYVYLWLVIFKQTLRSKSHLSFVVFASSVGLFVDSLFINSLFYPQLMLWMWMLIGLSLTIKHNKGSKK